MRSHVKEKPVQVLLSEEELRDLDRLVALRKRQEKDVTIGRATVLRQLALPQVRELLKQAAA